MDINGGSVDDCVESPLPLANDQIHHTFVHVEPAGIFDDKSGGLSMAEKVGGNGTFHQVREVQFKRNRTIDCVIRSFHCDGEKSRDMGREKKCARTMIIHDIDEGYLPAGFRVEYRHGKFHVSTIGGAEHVTLNESSHSVGNSLQLQNGILIEHFPNARFLEGRNNHGNVRLWRFVEKEWLETHRGELESLRGVADEGNGDVDEAEVLATCVDDENESAEETHGRRLQSEHHR